MNFMAITGVVWVVCLVTMFIYSFQQIDEEQGYGCVVTLLLGLFLLWVVQAVRMIWGM